MEWNCSKVFKTRDFLFRNSPPTTIIFNDRYLLFPRTRMDSTQDRKKWAGVHATSNRRHFDLWLENGNLSLESHENNHGFWATVQTISDGYPIFFLRYMTVWKIFEKCRHSIL